MKKPIVVVLMALVIAGWSPSKTRATMVDLGKQFQLVYGQSADISEANFKVTFKALSEESRCPEGAFCVWAGNAKVVISVSELEASLNTTLEPKQISHSGYTIQLLAVHPYPKLGEQHEPSDYVITLIVVKE